MSRVRVLVEGQTERAFVDGVLKPHFDPSGIYLHALMFRPRGGRPRYAQAKERIANSFKEDNDLICTTMVDFYELGKDWPGREQANSCRTVTEKAKTIEDALLVDVQSCMGDSFNPARFTPYVQMHEFEALLFSNPVILADKLESSLKTCFENIRDQFSSPEEINDNYETCPSRRIKHACPSYDKVADGKLISKAIGLEMIRTECPHFNEWLTKLESLRQ